MKHSLIELNRLSRMLNNFFYYFILIKFPFYRMKPMISDEVNVYKGNWLHIVNHEIGATSMLELINFNCSVPSEVLTSI